MCSEKTFSIGKQNVLSLTYHCIKKGQNWSFSGHYFPTVPTEYGEHRFSDGSEVNRS